MKRTARDLMHGRIRTIGPDASLVDLERELQAARVSGMPVVDKGRLVGIVSRSDIVRQLCVEESLAEQVSDFYHESARVGGAPPETLDRLGERVGARVQSLRVRDVMAVQILSVSPDAPVFEIARTLLEHRVHRVLVVGSSGELVGLVSALDLAGLLAEPRSFAREALRWLGLAAGGLLLGVMYVVRLPLSWFYRDRRPTSLGRIGNNALVARIFSLGIWPGRAVSLEVRGRRSGRPHTTALVMAEFEGDRYLVSMLGESADWVRNVRAAHGEAKLHHGRSEKVRLEEVPESERAPILKAYLKRAPGARPHVEVDVAAPLPEFQAVAHRYPTFRVVAA